MRKNLLKMLVLGLAFSNLGAMEDIKDSEKPVSVKTLERLKEVPTDTKALKLILGENDIGAEGVELLVKELGELGKLTDLKLGLNAHNIGYKGAERLGHGLGKLVKLTSLELLLENNKIGYKGAERLGAGLVKLTNLTDLKLNLKDNNIGAEGAIELGKELGELGNKLTSLELDLFLNNIGDEGAKSLLPTIKSLKHTELSFQLELNNILPETLKIIEHMVAKHNIHVAAKNKLALRCKALLEKLPKCRKEIRYEILEFLV